MWGGVSLEIILAVHMSSDSIVSYRVPGEWGGGSKGNSEFVAGGAWACNGSVLHPLLLLVNLTPSSSQSLQLQLLPPSAPLSTST